MNVPVKVWQVFASNHSTSVMIAGRWKTPEEAKEAEKRLKSEIGEDCLVGIGVDLPTIYTVKTDLALEGGIDGGCRTNLAKLLMEIFKYHYGAEDVTCTETEAPRPRPRRLEEL